MISPLAKPGKAIGFADRPLVPAVPRTRGPLDRPATLGGRTAQGRSIGFGSALGIGPHASYRADLACCSRLRDEPLRPYGRLRLGPEGLGGCIHCHGRLDQPCRVWLARRPRSARWPLAHPARLVPI
jgi:hypothetical protein